MTSVALLAAPDEPAHASMALYARQLACALGDAGLRASVVPAVAPDRPRGSLGRLRRYWSRYVALPRALRAVRADVYHVTDHANAHWLRVLPQRRTVVTCHDLILLKLGRGDFPAGPRPPRVASAAFRFSVGHLARAAAAVCDSESTRDDAVRLAGVDPGRAVVCPPGMDPAFRPLAAEERVRVRAAHAEAGTSLLLHVGGSFFYKNVEGLLRALALLPDAWRGRVRLLKAGERPTSSQVALAETLGIADRVSWLGALPRAELAALCGAVDVLVHPSLHEGFGWPPLEAMACDTPVVCSDRGALAETSAPAACVVDPDRPEDIARGIVAVLAGDAVRRDLVVRGRLRVRRYDWATCARQVAAVYERVLRGA